MNDGKPVAAGLYKRVELQIGKNIYTFYFQPLLKECVIKKSLSDALTPILLS